MATAPFEMSDQLCAIKERPNRYDMFKLRLSLIKLLIFNVFITLCVINQEVIWNYSFKDGRFSQRIGKEFEKPTVKDKFGLIFRSLSLIFNGMLIVSFIFPKRSIRNYLLLPLLWNIYMTAAISDIVFDVISKLCVMEVPTYVIGYGLVAGVFVIIMEGVLTFQLVIYYEFLNFAE